MNPSPDVVPVAAIGVGRMGRHHARIYHQMAEADLVAVVDPDLDRAGALADEYGCDALATVGELLDRHPQVAAASIAVPTVLHPKVAGPLLEQRVACLIEKPMAGSVSAAQEILETARRHKTLVQVGHTERFNPVVRAVSDLQITPRFIEVHRVSPMTFRSIDVGAVFDIMIHDLDIVLMLTQCPIKQVSALGVHVLGEHEDVANARIEFEDGCVANLTASRLALKTERRLRLFSETAYVSVDYARKTGVILSRTEHTETLEQLRQQIADGADMSDVDWTSLVNMRDIRIDDEEPLAAELSNFLAAAVGRAEPAVDAEAGCAAVAAAEQVVEAIRQHRWRGVDAQNPV